MIPVFVLEPVNWTQIEVPPAIVRVCSDYTRLNPHDENLTAGEDLRLLDCYWYHMKYYENNQLVVPPGW